MGRLPNASGKAFWRSLAEVNPPLVDGMDWSITCCPIRGRAEAGRIDYLGPRAWDSDVVGADEPGNHGPGAGGNVLRRSGDVIEAQDEAELADLMRRPLQR